MGISIFDAFPVLGSGFIFLPWAIYAFLNQEYYTAAILITTYLITLFVREFLEAKLLGKGLGLSPFFMLAAIFIGIQIFGVTGIFLGPLAIVLVRAILSLNKNIQVTPSAFLPGRLPLHKILGLPHHILSYIYIPIAQ